MDDYYDMPQFWWATVFAYLWFLITGLSIGSFLNVVIYRVPAGMAVAHPPSHCPRCQTRLGLRDNLPGFGWLLLRGKCRYCQVPIPARYVIVEWEIGLLTVGLFALQWAGGGLNLPGWNVPAYTGVFFTVYQMHSDLAVLFVFYLYLLIILVATAYIAHDGHRPQRWVLMPAAILGLVASCLLPVTRLVPSGIDWPKAISTWRKDWYALAGNPQQSVQLVVGPDAISLLTALLGAATGTLLGAALGLLGPSSHERPRHTIAAAWMLGLAGLYLGWQAALSVAIIAALLILIASLHSRLGSQLAIPAPTEAAITASTVLLIFTWRWSWQWLPLADSDSAWWQYLLQGLLALGLAWLAGLTHASPPPATSLAPDPADG